jgi:hypothetical protein
VSVKVKGAIAEVERLKQGVFFTHSGLVRFAMENQFKERWKQYYSSKLGEALSDILEED